MEPAHIFYNELTLDENNAFSANLAKNNEIELNLKNLKIMPSVNYLPCTYLLHIVN